MTGPEWIGRLNGPVWRVLKAMPGPRGDLKQRARIGSAVLDRVLERLVEHGLARKDDGGVWHALPPTPDFRDRVLAAEKDPNNKERP